MVIVKIGPEQAEEVLALYRAVAAAPASGLARRPDEIGIDYIRGNLSRDGVCLAAYEGEILLGELHAFRLVPRQFAHILTDLTVAVAPDAQGKGVGAALFAALFDEAARMDPPATRIELVVRAGNSRAIALYERLGFMREGCFRGRVVLPDGTVEDDIPMAWMR